MSKENKQKGKCVYPECDRTDIIIRGLCRKDYTFLNARVREGKYTWEEFVEVGIAKKSQQGKFHEKERRFENFMQDNLKS